MGRGFVQLLLLGLGLRIEAVFSYVVLSLIFLG